MNKQTLTKIIVLGCALVGLGMAPAARAGHFTDYLDTLSDSISNRIASGDTNLTAKQKSALNAASSILRRNSKTLGSDLQEFNAASTVLNRAFTDDADLSTVETQTLNNFLNAADAQRAALADLTNVGSNGVPKAVQNQIDQADRALTTAHDESGSTATRVRALNLAFTKLRVATMLATRFIKAPANVDGKSVTLKERSAHNPSTLTLDAGGGYSNDTETGVWSYTRTGASTATITITPNGGDARTVDLTFRNSTSGTYTTDGSKGTFTITTPTP